MPYQLSSRPFAQSKPPSYQIIHRVQCEESNNEELYLDAPWIVKSGPHKAHLRGSNTIDNFELHLERNKEIAFIVFKEFECCCEVPSSLSRNHPGASSILKTQDLLVKEYISNISSNFRLALKEICDVAIREAPHPNFIDEEVDQIDYPYLWCFHGRSNIERAKERLSPNSQLHLNLFQGYLNKRLGDEWAEVDLLLSTGHITAAYINYLFVCTINLP